MRTSRNLAQNIGHISLATSSITQATDLIIATQVAGHFVRGHSSHVLGLFRLESALDTCAALAGQPVAFAGLGWGAFSLAGKDVALEHKGTVDFARGFEKDGGCNGAPGNGGDCEHV